MKAHPAADRFPLLEGDRFRELVADIKARGLVYPIVLCEGKVLDGRNRERACQEAGVEPRYVEFTGDNPFHYAWSTNGQRRDLQDGQRTVIKALLDEDALEHERQKVLVEKRAKLSAAAKEQPRSEGGRLAAKPPVVPHDAGEPDRERHAAADTKLLAGSVEVSTGTAERALALIRSDRRLAEKVARGEVKFTQALREVKRASLSERIAALPEGKYRVVYADPPWKYGDERAGLDVADSAAASQYPTMSVADLCALDVRSLAADDAVLFCWATFPLLPDALEVAQAWGFKYKTAFVWAKGRPNLGNYHDASAELLLVCTRGSCTPETDERELQVQAVRREGRHSEKPEHFRGLIDRLYPTGPRVELFRRGGAPKGWVAWGNEA